MPLDTRFSFTFLLIIIGIFQSAALASNWQSIKAKKRLKVVISQPFYTPLPRTGSNKVREHRAIVDFAKSNGLKINWVTASTPNDAIESVKEGKADIFIGNVLEPSKTGMPFEGVSLTLPLYLSNDYLVANKRINLAWLSSLSDKVLGVKNTVRQKEIAKAIQGKFPSLKQVSLSETDEGDLLYRKMTQRYDFIILSGDEIDNDLTYRNDIQKYKVVSKDNPVTWVVNSKNNQLLNQLNLFIQIQKSNENKTPPVRVGLLNSYDGLYLLHGEKKGFHFDLINQFFSSHKIPFTFHFADSSRELKALAQEGKIDLAAHFFTHSDTLYSNLQATDEFLRLSNLLIINESGKDVKELKDVNGRFLSIPKGFEDNETLEFLKQAHPSIKFLKMKKAVPYRELMRNVDRGIYDMTIVPGFIANSPYQGLGQQVKALPLVPQKSYRWLVGQEHDYLLPMISDFLRTGIGSQAYGKYYKTHFEKPLLGNIKSREALFQDENDNERYMPFDDFIRKSSSEHPINWRLFVATLVEESGYDSTFGASNDGVGLLQVPPFIAGRLGYYELESPENNILAAQAYLKWIDRQLMAYGIKSSQRRWFVLAAFRVGLSHVQDAIHLAHKQQLLTSEWFGHVEKAMGLLERPEYHKKSRFGYVAGQDVLSYVRLIRDRYGLMRLDPLSLRSKQREKTRDEFLFLGQNKLTAETVLPRKIQKSLTLEAHHPAKQKRIEKRLLEQLGVSKILEPIWVPSDSHSLKSYPARD
jgi:membrane-bound lytic murein transglycosylase F